MSPERKRERKKTLCSYPGQKRGGRGWAELSIYLVEVAVGVVDVGHLHVLDLAGALVDLRGAVVVVRRHRAWGRGRQVSTQAQTC